MAGVAVVTPDGADTDMTRERAGEPDSAIIWSAPRMLGARVARGTAMARRAPLHGAELLRKQGERRRSRGSV